MYRIPVETGRGSARAGTGCLPSIRAKPSLSVEDGMLNFDNRKETDRQRVSGRGKPFPANAVCS